MPPKPNTDPKPLSALTDKEWRSLVTKEKKQIYRDTISMWHCGEFARMPPSHSINSFGIETEEQLKAIQWAIHNRTITPLMLDNVKKDGKKITALIVTDKNPFKVEFITIFDM